jgi:acetolactate synthase-1/2/3 large subunit/sulfoacetaldehyde acetyltransferase
MTNWTGGQAAVEALKAENTEFVFGLIGSATMEIFDALYDAQDIKLIGVHDERTGPIWQMAMRVPQARPV